MKASLLILCIYFLFLSGLAAQKRWTADDRAYLSAHLTQTRDTLLKETANLSEAQWNFKESPGRWSIKEVTEHIALWELLLMHEVSRALRTEADTVRTARPDSVIAGFILEEKPHVSVEYTQPFTYTLPMGLNDGKTNTAWFAKMRAESIAFIDSTRRNLRAHYMSPARPNIHQVYITIWGHCERHLQQIRKIKTHRNYPAR